MGDIDRFWSMVEKSAGCWLWTASKTTRGYGKIEIDGRTRLAHRVSWGLAYGAIPDGLQVLHNCPDGDRRDCVNPAHLFLGTQQDNIRDMVHKGRWAGGGPNGEQSGRAKLTASQVIQIRRDYATGTVSLTELSEHYSVSAHSIWAIVHHRSWRHIPPEHNAEPSPRLLGKREKLSLEQAREIRSLRASGIGPTELSRRYGIAISSVYRILNRQSWAES